MANTHSLSHKKILFIDDNKLEHYFMAHILIGTDAILYPAYTGKDGIDVAKAIIPDLIILDNVLPDISPLKVIEAIRKDVRMYNTPIILYTIQLLNDDWPVLQQAGVVELLIKHLPTNELIEKLQQHLVPSY
jgi:CheY-like chemotaxis protein